jgi:hypothetical protein
MQPTQEQLIKIGFLHKCAEDGLTDVETHLRVKAAIKMYKEANPLLTQLMSGAYGLGSGLISTAGKAFSAAPALAELGIGVGVGAPIAAGAMGGYGLAKLTSNDNPHALEEAKQDEITSEYERLSDEAKRRILLKRIQAQTGRKILPLSPSLG